MPPPATMPFFRAMPPKASTTSLCRATWSQVTLCFVSAS